MLIYGPYVLLVKLAHHRLAQPDRLILEPTFHAHSPVLGLVQENLPSAGGHDGAFVFGRRDRQIRVSVFHSMSLGLRIREPRFSRP